jgi:hypothetical protein
MRTYSGAAAKAATQRLKSFLLAGFTIAVAGASLPQPAAAQFFWEQPGLSPRDIAHSVMQQGFRPIAEPVRNNDVYVADAIDRRGRRERLIVNADSGQILQRFYVDFERGYRQRVDPTIPRGPVPPGRIPDEPGHSNIFSRLFGGDQDEAAPGPALQPQRDVPAPVHPRPHPKRPRTADREPETVRRPDTIESTPLAPPSAAAPSNNAAPSTPAPTATAPSDRPIRSIVRNPLSLPGTREDDAAAAAAKSGSSASAAASHATATKPATAAPAKVVPVAPLD